MTTYDVKAEFLFDFASPNAYLAHRALPGIAARTGTSFAYVPILLGGVFKATGNQPPWQVYAQVPAKLAYEELEMTRFARQHEIDMRMNPHFPVNTLTLMRGAIAAQRLNLFEAYVDAVFHYMWNDPRKMDDPQELMRALTEAGLPANDLARLVEDPDIKRGLTESTSAAVERGVFGIPTFFVNGEMYFGKDRLHQVERAIEEARRDS